MPWLVWLIMLGLNELDPECEIQTIEEFLEGDNLHLCAANNTNVDVEGVALLKFGLGSCKLPVPFLVTKEHLENPIVGYNLIKELVRMNIEELPCLLKNSIPALTLLKAEAVISLIKTDIEDEEEVAVAKRTVVPANSRCRVKCRTRFETSESKQNVTFTSYPSDGELEIPDSVVQVKMGKRCVNVVVTNPTNRPVTLEKGWVLGSVEAVSAIIPLGPEADDATKRKANNGAKGMVPSNLVQAQSVQTTELPKLDLSHLSEGRRIAAEKLLMEEKDVFCCGESDHGDVPDLVME